MTTPKRPRDANQLAKMVVDIASGQPDDMVATDAIEPMSVLGRSSGLNGARESIEFERR